MRLISFVFICLFFVKLSNAQTGSVIQTGTNGTLWTVFANNGVIGQPSTGGPRMAFRSPNNGYIGDLSFFASGRLKFNDNTDYNSSVVQSILESYPDSTFPFVVNSDVNRPTLSQERDFSGYHIGWVDGSKIYNADDSETWQEEFTEFPFFYNKRVGAEYYFLLSDSIETEFNLPPYNHGLDENQKGLGLSAEIRYIFPDSSYPAFQNNMLLISKVVNSSQDTIYDFRISYLVGSYIGVSGTDDSPQEYDDDGHDFLEDKQVAIFYDFPMDNSRNPFWIGKPAIGWMTITKMDETTQMNLVMNEFVPSNDVNLKDDRSLYEQMRKDTLITKHLGRGEEGDFILTSEGVNLFPGSEITYVSTVGFVDELKELDHNYGIFKKAIGSQFNSMPDTFIAFNSQYSLFQEEKQQLSWAYSGYDSEKLIDIELSGLNINDHFRIENIPIGNNYTEIDFLTVPDGSIYEVVLIDNDINKELSKRFIEIRQNTSLLNTTKVFKSNQLQYFFSYTDELKIEPGKSFYFKYYPQKKGSKIGNIKAFFGSSNGSIKESEEIKIYQQHPYVITGIHNGVVFESCNFPTLDFSFVDTVFGSIDGDDIQIITERYNARLSRENVYMEGDSLVDIKIVPGKSNSTSFIINGTEYSLARETNFVLIEPNTGDTLDYIFYDNNNDGNLGYRDGLVVLYKGENEVEQQGDTLMGIAGTNLYFSNSISFLSPSMSEYIVDSCLILTERALRGVLEIPIDKNEIFASINETPDTYLISAPYPNPFNPEVRFRLSGFGSSKSVKLIVYNLLGQQIESRTFNINDDTLQISWNATSVSSGLYLFMFEFENQKISRKAVLLK